MIGIGIDTGGTYTDAVIYDLDSKAILASSKALTTKEDLKIGIRNALDKFSTILLASCKTLSLSTTLATNACVENRGGKGKLVFIGLSRDTLEEMYQDYGIDSLDDVYLLECDIKPSVTASTQPDWEKFKKDLPEFCSHCDCISVVQLFAKEHTASYEKKAASIIKEVLNIPVIQGHELFPDLNIIRRGAGALLNARLIPVISEFLTAVKEVFASYMLPTTPVIVKSDGTLMSKEYTAAHPVETLLCGPAASIMGALALTEAEDALIVDMGGTTTDIAIVENGVPKTVTDGIQIGDWKTFVKGLFIDTFALGGDTAIHYKYDGTLYLEKYRVIPLCTLASKYPKVLTQLKELENYPMGHSYYMHEFYCLLKDIEDNPNYTDFEKEFCRALKDGPLLFGNAAKAVGKDTYSLNVSRLEEDGIIIRSGLTPTDIMHIRGDFSAHKTEASLMGAKFIARYAKISVEQLCENVYDLVEEKLYCNLVRILLQEKYFPHKKESFGEHLEELIHISYEKAKAGEETYFSTLFQTNAKLIAVGAPTHIFIEPVAKLLGTTAITPKYASVANAIGAIAGNVSVTKRVEIKPAYDSEELNGYEVISADEILYFEEYEEAFEHATRLATAAAIAGAKMQGATKDITTKTKIDRSEASIGASSIFLQEVVSVTATGKVN